MPKALLRVSKQLIAEAVLEGEVDIHEIRDAGGDVVEMVIEGASLPDVVPGGLMSEVRAVITRHHRTIVFERI